MRARAFDACNANLLVVLGKKKKEEEEDLGSANISMSSPNLWDFLGWKHPKGPLSRKIRLKQMLYTYTF